MGISILPASFALTLLLIDGNLENFFLPSALLTCRRPRVRVGLLSHLVKSTSIIFRNFFSICTYGCAAISLVLSAALWQHGQGTDLDGSHVKHDLRLLILV